MALCARSRLEGTISLSKKWVQRSIPAWVSIPGGLGTDGDASIAGDIAMLETEVTPTLKALRSHDLDVVAIHHHMTNTKPVIIFFHYWDRGLADKLAIGFKAALDELGKGGAR